MTGTPDNKVLIVVATLVFLVAMYFFSWTGLIVTFLVLLVLLIGYNVFWIRPRVEAANAILYEQGDPEAFLREMDELVRGRILPTAHASKTRDMLLVNRTAGLFFAGRWEEALEALDRIDPTKLPGPFRHLHFSNKLSCLNALEDVEGAQAWIAANGSLLEPLPRYPEYGMALEGNVAVLERLKGDRARSRTMLEALLAELERDRSVRRGLMLALTHYHLGRLDLDEGKTEDAKAHLTEAVRMAPKTYLRKEIESLLETA